MRWFAMSAMACLFALPMAGCPDDPKRPVGATCASAAECVSGLCSAGVCLDPDADDDFDGLSNALEVELGSSALNQELRLRRHQRPG